MKNSLIPYTLLKFFGQFEHFVFFVVFFTANVSLIVSSSILNDKFPKNTLVQFSGLLLIGANAK
jgi:hypothetical protein